MGLVEAGVIVGLSLVMLVLLYGQPRIFYTVASDSLLPSVSSRLSPRFHTPAAATWLLGGIVSLIAAFVPLALSGFIV
ncbi:amino acid permease [Flavobacterium sp.]|uniref:amino acid permease n=1 Tax=Flavobacterium sp. TaxID=239 RepID=UPI003D0C9AB6